MRKLIKKIVPDFILQSYRDYKKRQQIKPYLGDKVLCPLCNSLFNKFAPIGVVKRNAACPVCGSLERHRLLWKYLNEKTNLFTNNARIRLLHFAPERSFFNIFSKSQNMD